MSFLTILLFSSAFYFAQARPDTPAIAADASNGNAPVAAEVPQNPPVVAAEANSADVPVALEVPEDPSATAINFSQYSQQLDDFMEVLNVEADKWFGPMTASLDITKQQQYKTMLSNSFAGSINYILLVLEDAVSGNPGPKSYENDIIIQYVVPEGVEFNNPFIAEIPEDDGVVVN